MVHDRGPPAEAPRGARLRRGREGVARAALAPRRDARSAPAGSPIIAGDGAPTYATATPKLTDRDLLADFERRDVALLGQTKRVFVSGEGPAVIVMAELPGIYAHVARFPRTVRDAGFTVWMPALFGTQGGPVTIPGALSTMVRACVSRELRAFAANESSPVTRWLRALAAHALPLCGGKGVGAIGMCFTGNFALSMMLEPAMLAPMGRENLTVLAYRFEGDRFCKAERFAAYEAALGDRFQGRVLPDSCALPGTPLRPHSVVTLHLIDREGEPTRKAVEEILGFFAMRLKG